MTENVFRIKPAAEPAPPPVTAEAVAAALTALVTEASEPAPPPVTAESVAAELFKLIAPDKAEAKPAEQPADKPVTAAEMAAAVVEHLLAGAKPEAKADEKPEAKPDEKPEAKADEKPEAKPDEAKPAKTLVELLAGAASPKAADPAKMTDAEFMEWSTKDIARQAAEGVTVDLTQRSAV